MDNPPSDAVLAENVQALTDTTLNLVATLEEFRNTVASIKAQSKRDRAIVIFDIALSVVLFAMGIVIGVLYNHNAVVAEQLRNQQAQIVAQDQQGSATRVTGICRLYDMFFTLERNAAAKAYPAGSAAYDLPYASLHQSAVDLKCPTK